MNKTKEIQKCEEILKDKSLGYSQRENLKVYVDSLKLKLNNTGGKK